MDENDGTFPKVKKQLWIIKINIYLPPRAVLMHIFLFVVGAALTRAHVENDPSTSEVEAKKVAPQW